MSSDICTFQNGMKTRKIKINEKKKQKEEVMDVIKKEQRNQSLRLLDREGERVVGGVFENTTVGFVEWI